MTNKLTKKILLKFLEIFFEEFSTKLWLPQCEQIILYGHRHGITSEYKHGVRRKKCKISPLMNGSLPSSTPTRTKTSAKKRARLKQVKKDRSMKAYVRCENMITQYVTNGEVVG